MSSLEILSTLISAAIVCIIGVILLFIGRKTSRPRIYWGGIGFVLTAGIVVFVEFKEIRDVLTALAAICAAFIAAYSIDETRRLRQDNVDRESRDRKERLLNEIIIWSKIAIKRIFTEVKPLSEAIKETKAKRKIFKLPDELFWSTIMTEDAILESTRLETEITEAKYLLKMATWIDDKLADLISIVVDKMKSRKDLLFKSEPFKANGEKSPKDKKKWQSLLGSNAGELRESLLNVTNKALEIKLNI